MLSVISTLPAWLPALISSSFKTKYYSKSITDLPLCDQIVVFGLCVLTAAIVISAAAYVVHWTMRIEKLVSALVSVWLVYFAFVIVWVIVRVVFFGM